MPADLAISSLHQQANKPQGKLHILLISTTLLPLSLLCFFRHLHTCMLFFVLSAPSQSVFMLSPFYLSLPISVYFYSSPLCFIPSCTSSLFTLHLHPVSLAFNNSSSLSLGVQCMKQKSPQSHRQQALEHC